MFNDQTLQVDVKASLTVPPFIALTVKAVAPFEWGAPVKDFKVGEPAFKPYNRTHILISLPVSFRNNSPYVPVEADVKAELIDAKEQLKGVGTLTIKAGPKTTFKETVNLSVKFSEEELNELLFKDTRLNYKLLLKIMRGGIEAFTLTELVSYSWGAPVKDLKLGKPEAKPYNATHFKLEVPMNFTNNSDLYDLKANLTVDFYDAIGRRIGIGIPQTLNVPAKTTYRGKLQGLLSLTALGQQYTAKLTFETPYGKAVKEVVLTA